MKENNESFSNIQFARSLSLKLTGTPGQAPKTESAPQVADYTRLAVPQKQVTRATVVQEPPAIEIPDEDFRSWEEVVHWMKKTFIARAAFVLDSQGFIITQDSEMHQDMIEEKAIPLSEAIKTLGKIEGEGEVQLLDLKLERDRVSAYVVKDSRQEEYIVGVISPEPQSPTDQMLVFEKIYDSARQL